MQKHLTPSEFSEKFFKQFEEAVFRPSMSQSPNHCDSILATVFDSGCSWHKQIKEHLECQVTEALDYEESIQSIGYNFHKGFRSWDPVDSERINSVTWTAISGSKVFWDVLNTVCEEFDQGVKNFEKVLDTGDN
jgi:hypothetical protein